MTEEKVERKTNKTSVRWRILTAVAVIQIPVIVLYFFIVNSFIDRFISQQWEYQQRECNKYVTNLGDAIIDIDKFLYSDFYVTPENYTEEHLPETAVHIQDVLGTNEALNSLMIFDQEGKCILKARIGQYVLPEKAVDALYLASLEAVNNGWHVDESEGQYYLTRQVQAAGMKAVAVISIERLAAAAGNVWHLLGTPVFEQGGKRLSNTIWSRNAEEEIPSSITKPFILKSGKREYMLCETNLIGMRVIYGSSYQYSFRWLYIFGYMMLGLAVLSMLVVMFYLRWSIILPLRRITGIMQQISSGSEDLRLPEENSSELQEISDTFNEMMDNLKDAKIESYEHRLTARRAKMDALRLQIRRHFFLNCLKNIYAMASVGDYAGIKETAYLLSGNLRYTLNFDEDTVPLHKEIEMCEDYIKLQGVGQTVRPMLLVDSNPELDDFEIPPVSLLTILENSCKYGKTQDTALIIRIKTAVRKLDDSGYALITIQDNGPGFAPDMLKLLNQDMNKVQENNHIGMANTLLRFKMLYGEDCSVLFSNSHGAKVELMIPMKRVDKQEDESL